MRGSDLRYYPSVERKMWSVIEGVVCLQSICVFKSSRREI